MALYHTRGVVLRTVKYGDTSVIVSIYTELFGIQSYIVNGVRTSSKKSTNTASLFQPAVILDLVVYHNELKNLQRIKEFKWGFLYEHLLFDVIKNAVAMYMIELLQKTIKQPEANPDLFNFVEDALTYLDRAEPAVVANFALYVTLHLPSFFGFQLQDNYSDSTPVLDLQNGLFIPGRPEHPYFLEEPLSGATAQILRSMQPHELGQLRLRQETRRLLLTACQDFYRLHFTDFGTMKSLPVLYEVLS